MSVAREYSHTRTRDSGKNMPDYLRSRTMPLPRSSSARQGPAPDVKADRSGNSIHCLETFLLEIISKQWIELETEDQNPGLLQNPAQVRYHSAHPLCCRLDFLLCHMRISERHADLAVTE